MSPPNPTPLLANLRAAVLGSSSGIGRATAIALAHAGARVIVHGRKSRQQADQVARQCIAAGAADAAIFMADVSDERAGDRLVDEAWAQWGGLDAWLHLAGADTLTGENARLSYEQKLTLLLSVDVISTMRLCRRVGQLMAVAGGGSIVTMGWNQAETGMEGDSGELFAATKGAVMAFTRSLALSMAPRVRVNCVAPGWIKTAWGEGASQAWQDRAVSEAPLARWGTPEDVAAVCCFLVGPGASFLTGQIMRIDGGAVR